MATARPSAPPPPQLPPAMRSAPPPPATPAERAPDLMTRLRDAAAGTPGTMRLIGIGAVVVLVLAGLLGALSASTRGGAIDDARAEAAQLVRLQTVRTSLVQADAAATNAFLVGGLEPATQRSAYEAGISAATTTLSEAAANADADDAATYGRVGESITRYTGLIESARANNRQGFPVGVAYLRQASSLLRGSEGEPAVLDELAGLSAASQADMRDAYRDSRSAMEWLWTGAAVALVVLVLAQAYLTTRTRRLLSMPVLVAFGIVLVSTVLATAVLSWSQAQADDVRDGDYADSVALAQARVFAFDAKSAESLTLIARGSGQAFEQQFVSLSTAARDTLLAATIDSEHVVNLRVYLEVHEQVRLLDDENNWDGAVALATTADGGSNAAFDQFATSTDAELSEKASRISDDLDDASTPLGVLAVLLVLAGIAAAIAAWQGVATRLKEYR